MFKSSKEKHAYKQVIKKGRKGGTVWENKKKSHSKSVKKKINPLDRYAMKNKRSGKKIFPQNRNRYFLQNHLHDFLSVTDYVYSSYHSSLSDAESTGAKREAEDRKQVDSHTSAYYTISGPKKEKFKVKKRTKR